MNAIETVEKEKQQEKKGAKDSGSNELFDNNIRIYEFIHYVIDINIKFRLRIKYRF